MTSTLSEREEFVTIIAPTAAEAMRQFRDQGLAALGYAIAGRIGRHRFSLSGNGDQTELFDGEAMIAATFVRRVPA
ncbi:MAG TPA: hypothetical protein VIL84_02620 [Devosiaceae bacterium]